MDTFGKIKRIDGLVSHEAESQVEVGPVEMRYLVKAPPPRGYFRYADGVVSHPHQPQVEVGPVEMRYIVRSPPPTGYFRYADGLTSHQVQPHVEVGPVEIRVGIRQPRKLFTGMSFEEKIIQLFNEENQLSLTADQVIFGVPRPTGTRWPNTNIELTMLPESRFQGSVTVSYQRGQISDAFSYDDPFFENLPITEGSYVHDYLPEINAHFDYQIEERDVENNPVEDGVLRLIPTRESRLFIDSSRTPLEETLLVTDLHGFEYKRDLGDILLVTDLDGFESPPFLHEAIATFDLDGFSTIPFLHDALPIANLDGFTSKPTLKNALPVADLDGLKSRPFLHDAITTIDLHGFGR